MRLAAAFALTSSVLLVTACPTKEAAPASAPVAAAPAPVPAPAAAVAATPAAAAETPFVVAHAGQKKEFATACIMSFIPWQIMTPAKGTSCTDVDGEDDFDLTLEQAHFDVKNDRPLEVGARLDMTVRSESLHASTPKLVSVHVLRKEGDALVLSITGTDASGILRVTKKAP